MVERHELVTRGDYDDGASERTSDEIRQDIAARRESITETVDKLSERVNRTLDWRVYVTEHPLVATGLAAGIGVLAAGIFRPRLTPSERILAALSETVEDVTGRFREQLEQLPSQQVSSRQSMQAVAAALVAKAVASYVSNRMVGTTDTNRDSTQFSTPTPREESTIHSTSGFE